MRSQPHSAAVSAAAALEAVTAGALHRELAGMFRAAGVATPGLDARLLVCRACGLTHEQFASVPSRAVTAEVAARIAALAERRRAREPVSRILGAREFRGLEFAISPETLDPRPDTETLVEAALELAAERPPGAPLTILDLGTGSGCILVSLLHELDGAVGTGTDISAGALAVARANAHRHGLDGRARFVCTSWSDGLDGTFDMVVANPPYIPVGAIAGLEPEVRQFDPRGALDGGADGLDAYREILPRLGSLLTPGGWAVFEVGAGQSAAVQHMFASLETPLRGGGIRQWRDLSGHPRCLAVKRSPFPEKEEKGVGNFRRSR